MSSSGEIKESSPEVLTDSKGSQEQEVTNENESDTMEDSGMSQFVLFLLLISLMTLPVTLFSSYGMFDWCGIFFPTYGVVGIQLTSFSPFYSTFGSDSTIVSTMFNKRLNFLNNTDWLLVHTCSSACKLLKNVWLL